MIITGTSVPLMCGTLMSPNSTVRECVDSSSRAIFIVPKSEYLYNRVLGGTRREDLHPSDISVHRLLHSIKVCDRIP